MHTIEALYDQIKSHITHAYMEDADAYLYWRTSEQNIDHGDESGFYLEVFTENVHAKKHEEAFSRITDNLLQDISDLIKDTNLNPLIKAWGDGYVYEAKNDFNDWVKVQFTDNTIYLMMMQSGQH